MWDIERAAEEAIRQGLHRARREQGLSYRALAARLGVAYPRVYEFLVGQASLSGRLKRAIHLAFPGLDDELIRHSLAWQVEGVRREEGNGAETARPATQEVVGGEDADNTLAPPLEGSQ